VNRNLAAALISAWCAGCTFDTSGASITDPPWKDMAPAVDVAPKADLGPRPDRRLPDSARPDQSPDAPRDMGVPDAPADAAHDAAPDMAPDTALPDGPLPDTPIPDMPGPDQFVWPDVWWPDAPVPDAPLPDKGPDLVTFPDQYAWPDSKPWPDLKPHDMVAHDKVPWAPDLFPLPSCKSLFGWVDGYKLCKETTTSCRFWHDEGFLGGSYSCDQLCKSSKKYHQCLDAHNTNGFDKCGKYNGTKCSSKHNSHTCNCSKW